MVAKNEKVKKVVGKEPRKENLEEKEDSEGGMDLKDAFADDEDVEYGKSKTKKIKTKKLSEKEIAEDIEEAEEELEEMQTVMNHGEEKREISIKASKPVSKIKKGDKIWVDDNEFEVDSHYMLMDHDNTKEMTIELFDKNDKDYQLRYFSDQVENTIEFYELQEIMYFKKPIQKVEW